MTTYRVRTEVFEGPLDLLLHLVGRQKVDIRDIQGIRIVLSIVISSLAAVIFIIRGHLAWDAVYMFMIGTLIGGWLGTLLVRRLSANVVRALIIATGLVTTLRLALTS